MSVVLCVHMVIAFVGTCKCPACFVSTSRSLLIAPFFCGGRKPQRIRPMPRQLGASLPCFAVMAVAATAAIVAAAAAAAAAAASLQQRSSASGGAPLLTTPGPCVRVGGGVRRMRKTSTSTCTATYVYVYGYVYGFFHTGS